jgi:signal peptide peptidase SppA
MRGKILKILDIINSQWAITNEAFNQLLFVFGEHQKGPKIDLKSLETAVLKYEPGNGIIREAENVSIIQIHGPLMKRPSVFERVVFGAVSMQGIQEEIENAIDDPLIDTIILDIDSPGGTVDGTKELADYIYNARDKKKIVAYSDGMIASAGYWIASAAEEIYISNETVEVGSVGVRLTHVDYSAINEAMGINITEIYAGKYKTAGSPDKPLDPDSKDYLQSGVDTIYSIFVNDVARNRGLTVEYVLENIADARLYMGESAVSNKLVDGVSTLNLILDERKNMEFSEFKAHEHAEKFKAEILDSAKKDFEAELENVKKEALENERKRIADINALSLPGYENIVAAGIESGKSAADVGIEILKAQKEEMKHKAEEFDADGPEIQPEVEPEIDVEEKDDKEIDVIAMINDYAKENNCSKSKARAAVIREYPEAFEKFISGGKE